MNGTGLSSEGAAKGYSDFGTAFGPGLVLENFVRFSITSNL
jgi:hypothetical protein